MFTHLRSSLQHTISNQVEKHPHYFHHDDILGHSQYPPCHASLKILDEVNWVIKTLQMGSWRSMIKKRVRSSLPHWLPLHPLYSRSLIIETKRQANYFPTPWPSHPLNLRWWSTYRFRWQSALSVSRTTPSNLQKGISFQDWVLKCLVYLLICALIPFNHTIKHFIGILFWRTLQF